MQGLHIREKEKTIADKGQRQEEIQAYTYMVECADGTLYTGWTNHLAGRMASHNAGTGAKYTRSRRPVRLVYYEEYTSKREAMQREYAIKQCSRDEKLDMIRNLPPERKKVCMEIMRQIDGMADRNTKEKE